MSIYAGSYGGITWGATGVSPYTVDKATGFEDLPSLRRRATPRSQQDGQWFGRYLLDQHILTLDLHVVPTATKTLDQACDDLLMATPRQLDTTSPLIFKSGTRVAFVKVANRTIARDHSGNYAAAHIQFEMPDMHIFEEPYRQLVLPSGSIGVSNGSWVPMQVPFFILQNIMGQGTVHNYGNETAYPIIIISGPSSNPQLLNITAQKRVSFQFVLGVNDSLLVDFSQQSAILNGQTARTEATESDWWGLAPNSDSLLHYLNDVPDPASTATVQWRSSWA